MELKFDKIAGMLRESDTDAADTTLLEAMKNHKWEVRYEETGDVGEGHNKPDDVRYLKAGEICETWVTAYTVSHITEVEFTVQTIDSEGNPKESVDFEEHYVFIMSFGKAMWFTMPYDNVLITANIQALRRPVGKNGLHCTIECEDSAIVQREFLFRIVPDEGYALSSLSVTFYPGDVREPLALNSYATDTDGEYAFYAGYSYGEYLIDAQCEEIVQ